VLQLLREAIVLLVEEAVPVQTILSRYPNVPEYVVRDMHRGEDMHTFALFDRLRWELETLHVNPSDFAPATQEQLAARGFGDLNPGNVPHDQERVAYQRQRAEPGTNEPIIVVKAVDGFRLSVARKGVQVQLLPWALCSRSSARQNAAVLTRMSGVQVLPGTLHADVAERSTRTV
jgi:hypothetical protein